MDDEMIERVAKAIRVRCIEHSGKFVGWRECAKAAIKAMREPTQAQYDALCATNKIWSELDSLTVWRTYIDAVINE